MKLLISVFFAVSLFGGAAMAASQVATQCPTGWITIKRPYVISSTSVPSGAQSVNVQANFKRTCSSLQPLDSTQYKMCALYLKSGEEYIDNGGTFTVSNMCFISGL